MSGLREARIRYLERIATISLAMLPRIFIGDLAKCRKLNSIWDHLSDSVIRGEEW